MRAIYEEECFLSPEAIIRAALRAAEVRADLETDAEDIESAGWARRAFAANGFGGAACVPDD